MRLFSICRNCAEVHPVESACPACHPIPDTTRRPAARTPPHRRFRDEAAVIAAVETAPARRRLWGASTLLVSAYLVAVLVLILAVVAQA